MITAKQRYKLGRSPFAAVPRVQGTFVCTCKVGRNVFSFRVDKCWKKNSEIVLRNRNDIVLSKNLHSPWKYCAH
jgi:hypothetical protein